MFHFAYEGRELDYICHTHFGCNVAFQIRGGLVSGSPEADPELRIYVQMIHQGIAPR